MNTKKTSIAVVMGGRSRERDVSLKSGRQVSHALRSCGYAVRDITLDSDMARLFACLTPRPDCVFNALHGRWGEDGCVQGMLELMDIPYTHSGVLASALAMDKSMAQQVVEAQGIQCPPILVLTRRQWQAEKHFTPPFMPYVIKPLGEGSSFGVRIVTDARDGLCETDFSGTDRLVIQQYIKGRELTVAVLENRSLGVLEILPRGAFYDTDSKYADGGSRHIMPAKVSNAIAGQCMESAQTAHRVLGCRGVSRSDFIYRQEDEAVFFIEINTQPGMTRHSLVPTIAAHAGIPFADLVARLVEEARS